MFPKFSAAAKSKYRFFAVDLLGFGKSPRPTDSLYTLREHVEMIEKSVLEAHKVKSFHIVAHSLGCILALAIAVRHRRSVKSVTLLAPVRHTTRQTIYIRNNILLSYISVFFFGSTHNKKTRIYECMLYKLNILSKIN